MPNPPPESTPGSKQPVSSKPRTPQPSLKREFGFLDLVLYYVVCGMSLRWIATAAESGPSSIVVWLFAWIAFFLPLAACVLELSSRYPQEGGLYVWAREGYGDFAGFMAAWSYWMSNLPYFATVLYFSASCALFAAGRHGAALANDSTYFMAFSLTALGLITFLNMRGVKLTKLLNTTGAIGMIVPIIVLIVLGVISWFRSGSATHFTMFGMMPHGSIKNAIFWSTIFLAFGGVESASFMGGEIKEPRKTIPRALIFAGILITLGYVGGTVAMLVALPSEQISGLGGFMTAIAQMCNNLAPKSFASWTGAAIIVIALLVAISNLGNACAYLASCSRLPFVAGIDNYLPAVFGRVHPRWNTPYIAILVYGLGGMLFAFLGQAGTSVKGAYDVLVSMSIITFFIPYLFLFGTMIRVQNRPVSADVIRVPGGRRAAIPLAILGILTTLLTIALSVLPADDEPNKPLAVLKIIGLTMVMLGAGVIVYAQGKRRQAHKLAALPTQEATL